MANIFKKDETGQFSRVLSPQAMNPAMYGTGNLTIVGSRALPSVDNSALTPGQFNNTPPVATAPTRTLTTPTPPQIQPPAPTYTPPIAPPTPTPQVNNPYDAFNLLLQNSLKTAQKINTTDLLAQQRALQRASIQRTQNTGTGVQPTAEELKFLSPGQQESMRSADVGALSAGIDEVAYKIQKATQDKKDAIEAIMLAKDSGDKARTFEAEQKWKQADADYKTATLAETKRSNLATEGITRAKNAATGSSYLSTLATSGRQAISGLLAIANKNPGIFGRTAAIPIPDFLRSDDYRNYQAQLDYLKGNIIPAALSAMREASKTGGALGQVSDKEGAWLASSLGALSMSQDSESAIEQLKLIDESMARWQNAVTQSGGQSGTGGNTNLPQQMTLNGQTLTLQADGTYK